MNSEQERKLIRHINIDRYIIPGITVIILLIGWYFTTNNRIEAAEAAIKKDSHQIEEIKKNINQIKIDQSSLSIKQEHIKEALESQSEILKEINRKLD